MATGNYYLFLDSDDFLRSDACELLSKTAAESGADLVTFKETMVYDDKVRVAALPAPAPPPRGQQGVFDALAGRKGGHGGGGQRQAGARHAL